jgi:four helix bundle protein
MQDYRKLLVWRKAHQLTLDSYDDAAKHLAHRAAWELRSQVHRAAISIPSNLAEGAGRGSNSDFRRFCFYSLGSINELEYDLLLAKDLRFLPVDLHDRRAEQLQEVRRMLSSFAQSLETST